ncbi:PIN domain-containing protein [Paracoccus sp. 1_MG-2023]|uniref:RSP_2648 family PIN domain-containing protein n=1 Tax=unclassified Paracoccus (in: a-proteobacteria) TaxID=2688777 RepID=UPI001C08F35E|nr:MULTISPECIES: PIN domain-containing protein [unclassified Paracoccus (in: a-proteobacteria)]MBU2958503.1 PIN domain-containing protein [Paracoccus sp. C2R09]MDO6668512.1 PIN domain-containing protein [Paracoccus sp. 1_MG-2023]
MRAVLDANVLFPTILREILTDLGEGGLYRPMWSDRILGEWHRAAIRLGPVAAEVAGAEIAMLCLRFPQAVQPDDGDAAIDLDFPDPADRHVVEAALAGDAALIVTANLRDFPRPLMERLGLRAIHPDAFLLDLHATDPAAVRSAVESARLRAEAAGGAMSVAELLKRCRLPRLAKLMKI